MLVNYYKQEHVFIDSDSLVFETDSFILVVYVFKTYVYVFFNLQYVLALHTDSVPTCEHQIWGDDYECKTQGGGGQGEPKILYKQGWDTCI